ncbi:glycosyltransferase family 2 protein, partial [Longispora fulva]|uniref:glycosyltransferase family 2 protein n=2 Tax=Bacteria TaxID=2 RepID=UPI003627CA98
MFLGETLNSVITQSFSDWECIVVDDGSNDHTAELMEFYTNIDDRILYYQRPEDRPKGANACRNFGLENSKGKYIQWLDSDDIISPDKLEKQYQQLETNNATISFSRWGRLSISGESKIFEQLPVYRNFKSSYQFFEILADSVGYLP